jgi:hypothetical protein
MNFWTSTQGDASQINPGWWFQPYPSEKYEVVNGKDDIPNIVETKKCSKPPTSNF